MRFHALAQVTTEVRASRSRLAKRRLLAECFRGLAADARELRVGAYVLAGELPQGKIGVGGAQLRDVADVAPAVVPSLSIAEVAQALTALSALGGSGVSNRRTEQLTQLFSRATKDEQELLSRLLVGEIRQGALTSLVLDALAEASGLSAAMVRKAHMLAPDIGAAAEAAMSEGETGLKRFDLRVLEPVAPMLAQPAEDVEDAITRLGTASFELKLDGARIQVHRAGDTVRVFTRRLNEVSARVPEIVEAVLELPARELVLDGEVVSYDRERRPRSFQETMARFGTRSGGPSLRAQVPLEPHFFDCLYVDGRSLLDAPLTERHAALDRLVPEAQRVPRQITNEPDVAAEFFRWARSRGHEGLMAKALDSPYVAGSRGAAWLKIKHAHTLDLVVLAAEWGSGRRKGWLSNLHLGARDEGSGRFVMLGKTFKGLTDEVLAWQTEQLLAREVRRDGHVVYVRPELVVEIAFNDVQTSRRYPAGLALRFARVKGYRPDKTPEEADTLTAVRAIHAMQNRANDPQLGLEGIG